MNLFSCILLNINEHVQRSIISSLTNESVNTSRKESFIDSSVYTHTVDIVNTDNNNKDLQKQNDCSISMSTKSEKQLCNDTSLLHTFDPLRIVYNQDAQFNSIYRGNYIPIELKRLDRSLNDAYYCLNTEHHSNVLDSARVGCDSTDIHSVNGDISDKALCNLVWPLFNPYDNDGVNDGVSYDAESESAHSIKMSTIPQFYMHCVKSRIIEIQFQDVYIPIHILCDGMVFLKEKNNDMKWIKENLEELLISSIRSYLDNDFSKYQDFTEYLIYNSFCHLKGDPLGCLGLTFHTLVDCQNTIILSSVPVNCKSIRYNINPRNIYALNLNCIYGMSTNTIISYPSKYKMINSYPYPWVKLLDLSSSSSLTFPDVFSSIDLAAIVLKNLLQQVITMYINGLKDEHQSIGIMFSGGLDSGILACLLAQTLPMHMSLDLINISYGLSFEVPDRLTSLSTYLTLRDMGYTNMKLICYNILQDEIFENETIVFDLIQPNSTHMDFNIGSSFFFCSRGRGSVIREDFAAESNSLWWKGVNEKNLKEYSYSEELKKPRQNPRVVNQLCQCGRYISNSCCMYQLCRSCCCKKCSDYTLSCSKHKHNITRIANISEPISHCVYQSLPLQSSDIHNSVTTKSKKKILCTGCSVSHELPCYVSHSSFLFSGNGADELLGGYSRYKTLLKTLTIDEIRTKLISDVNNLWISSLSRDYRCMQYWKKQPIYPYLDKEIVQFILKLPMEFIIDEFENKLILRKVAKLLNLKICSKLKKRAIQFGSRATRHTNLTFFSSNRKASGNVAYVPLVNI